MRVFWFVLRKEFIQIFRDRTMLPLIFVVPVIQLIVLAHAATFEMKEIKMVIVDNDLSQESRALSSHYQGSPFYEVSGASSTAGAHEDLLRDRVDVILEIPEGFSAALHRNEPVDVQFRINAINTMSAGLVKAYSTSILRSFAADRLNAYGFDKVSPLTIQTRFWYNPSLNYHHYMVPGILVILVTIIGIFLTALNVVREKEMGTIEQVNVSPVAKHQLLFGKLLPAWCIAMFELSFGLLIGWIIFGQPVVGSLLTLNIAVAIYLLAALGLGLLLSTMASTQQQVMLLAFFFMLFFILLSGIFTPIEAIPAWARALNYINPVAYLMPIMRMILLKGSGLAEIWPQLLQLAAFAIVLMLLAIWRYRKTN
jgi:ABC-2 type transport system permease protein